MYEQRERSFTSSWASSAGSPHSTRWVAWMPLLFVAAFLYWSVALGLGGLSLMAASAISGDLDQGPELAPPSVMEPAPGHVFGDPIVVHLEESAEPEDVNDNAGAATPGDGRDQVDQVDGQMDVDDGTGRLPGQSRN